ncbi:ScpA family protein [Atopobiaceae bacterium 24-176]
MSFRVQTGQFSGPFDLLLSLVSRQKVDIGAISVAEVADQFLAEVERMGGMDLEVASDFVLVASTLLDIKAASLVPADGASSPTGDEEDEDDFLDLSPDEARDVLVARLMAYKQFRNAGAALGARMEAESRMHPRTAGPDPEFLGVMPDFLEGVTLRGLAVICADAESRRQGFLLEAEHVAPRRLPVALAAASVDRVVRSHGCTSFSQLLDGSRDPEAVVVTFLAILELFKRGMVRLSQAELFGDIDVAAVEGAGPYEPTATDLQDMEDEL